MAYIYKTKTMLKLEVAYNIADIRLMLLESYRRHNTIRAVAFECQVTPRTMSRWFAMLGLHTRASVPACGIVQEVYDTPVEVILPRYGTMHPDGARLPTA